MQAQI